MKNKSLRTLLFSLQILLFLALNWGGDQIVSRLNWPIWLDSVGTVLCAYLYGPVCGAIVGTSTNLLAWILYETPWYYAIVSILIAVIVGIASRRKKLDTLLDTLTTSAILAGSAAVVAYPINYLGGGSTGSNWGDAVIGFLAENGFPRWGGLLVGELYMELLDKLVILVTLFLIVRAIRLIEKFIRSRKRSDEEDEEAAAKETAAKAAEAAFVRTGAMLLALLIGASAVISTQGRTALSEEETVPGHINYNDYVQTVYSTTNGLPCGEANAIGMTNDGVLWVGTYAGLYRYNGREFRRMSELDSVRNVNCLYVDEQGRLWIGTNDNGLSIMINEKIVNIIDRNHGLPSNSVKSIIQSTDGYYYIGTTAGMQVLTLNTGLQRVGTLSEVNYADHIAADDSGYVAAVNNKGYLFLIRQGKVVFSTRLTGSQDYYTCCSFEPDGSLLVGTYGDTIYRFVIDGDILVPAGDSRYGTDKVFRRCDGLKNIKTLMRMENGELFICADNGIAHIETDGTYQKINTGNFNNSIDHMLVDYQDNLWFTSSRLGLLRLAPSDFRNLYNAEGFNLSRKELQEMIEQDSDDITSAITSARNKVVNTVVQWNGNFYIGTDEGMDAVDSTGRNRITGEDDPLVSHFSGNRIRCMIVEKQENEDEPDHLWVCTADAGLVEVVPIGKEHANPPDETDEKYQYYEFNNEKGNFGKKARVAYQMEDGTVLAAADDWGLSFIRDHDVDEPLNESNGNIKSKVLAIAELPDEDHTILAGTDGDGIAVIKNRKVKNILTKVDGLSSEVILRIVPDSVDEGAAYIVTGNGLCYMEPDHTIRALDRFPYYNNYSLWVRDEDTLFVFSSAGIYIVNRDDLLHGEGTLEYDLLDVRQGLNGSLTANSWTWYSEESHELYLPSNQGVFVMNTESLTKGTRYYRMNVAGIKTGETIHRVERGVTTIIPRDAGKIEILPEVINYSIQDPDVGFYLEGFDSDWSIVPQNSLSSIVYSNLPPGDYVFHLAIYDGNQNTPLTERVYPISIPKEMYDNNWFIFYILFVPMFTVFWVTWLLLKRHERKVQAALDLANKQVEMGKQTVAAIAKAVDAKDERTGGHSTRVALYSGQIAKKYGMDEKQCREIEWAAQLHDIGKIAIPDAILNKDSRLTDDEYAIMKSHTIRGAEILKDFTLLDHVTEGARYHHERPDGRGYPSGLKGEDIPLYARIIGVADAFDAMTANRVYRKQMDFGYVLGELEKGRGTQFAPEFVDILLELIRTNVIDLNVLYGIKPEDQTQNAEAITASGKPEEKQQQAADAPVSGKLEEKPQQATDTSAPGKGGQS